MSRIRSGEFEIGEARSTDAKAIGHLWAEAGLSETGHQGAQLCESMLDLPGTRIWTVRGTAHNSRSLRERTLLGCAVATATGRLGRVDYVAVSDTVDQDRALVADHLIGTCETWLQTSGVHRVEAHPERARGSLAPSLDRRGFFLCADGRRAKWLRREAGQEQGHTSSPQPPNGPRAAVDDEHRAKPLVLDENGRLEVTVTFLQMTRPPTAPQAPAPAGLEIFQARSPTLSYYRYLYNAVGHPWLWWERRIMDDTALARVIGHPKVEVFVPFVSGVPAGLIELDHRQEREVYLAYFGLMPEFIGKGLGSFCLDWTIRHAWQGDIRCLLVNTCTFDHRGALPLYQRNGFQIYRRETTRIPDPRRDPRYLWPL